MNSSLQAGGQQLRIQDSGPERLASSCIQKSKGLLFDNDDTDQYISPNNPLAWIFVLICSILREDAHI